MITQYNHLSNRELVRLGEGMNIVDPFILELMQRVPDTDTRPERRSDMPRPSPEQMRRTIRRAR